MNSCALYFTAPGQIELREESVPAPGASQVLVETQVSAISAGTEMLIYRGQFPRDLANSHDPLSGNLHYPLCYGYASVGRIKALGKLVEQAWHDRLVFSFQPHRSHYLAAPEELFPLPDSVSADSAVFLPNMETAVNFVQDAAPILGECALVLGQGIVGLLTASLLREFPLQQLVTADRYQVRRQAALELGAAAALDPSFDDFRAAALQSLPSSRSGFDLTLELSGNPAALDDAIALTMFNGRIVIGSWYGEKRAPVDLGGKFHRSRIEIVSSQVSTISPRSSARWSKSRRFEVVWAALKRVRPEKWITHQFAIGDASEAYRLLDQSPEQAIQVVLNYS